MKILIGAILLMSPSSPFFRLRSIHSALHHSLALRVRFDLPRSPFNRSRKTSRYAPHNSHSFSLLKLANCRISIVSYFVRTLQLAAFGKILFLSSLQLNWCHEVYLPRPKTYRLDQRIRVTSGQFPRAHGRFAVAFRLILRHTHADAAPCTSPNHHLGIASLVRIGSLWATVIATADSS